MASAILTGKPGKPALFEFSPKLCTPCKILILFIIDSLLGSVRRKFDVCGIITT